MNVGRTQGTEMGYTNGAESGTNKCQRDLYQTDTGRDEQAGTEDRRCGKT